MAVSDLHPDYVLHSPEWARTEAAAIGSPALRKNPMLFLPEAYANDDPERYKSFISKAYYVNLTGRTEQVLQGMVFRKPATFEVPTKMHPMLEDMDGNGEHIDQISKNALIQRLRKNRFVFLADYPTRQSGLTEKQERDLNLRPFVSCYTAEAVINWRWGSVGGRKRLVMVALLERKNISDDEFGHQYENQYRVLRLTDGIYTQQIYGKDGNAVAPEMPVLQAKKKPFNHIPIHGIRTLETAAMQPIAEINLAHYRNTASLEDMVSVIGSPGLAIDVGETSMADWKEHNSSEVKVGNRNALITKGGGASFFQAEERPLIRTVRDDKMAELAAIGASIVTRGGQTETAEAARIRAGSETSQLSNEVGDLSEDLEGLLQDMARFEGQDPDKVKYKLNTDFFEAGLTAVDLNAIVQSRILFGDEAALHMIREGRIELPSDKTNEELLLDAANSFTDDV